MGVPEMNTIVEAFASRFKPFFSLPPQIGQDMISLNYDELVQYCTPSYFRSLLRSKAQAMKLNDISIALPVLQFVLSDLDNNTYNQLEGLNLAPLASGYVENWNRSNRYLKH